MEAGITNHLWKVGDNVDILDAGDLTIDYRYNGYERSEGIPRLREHETNKRDRLDL